MEEARFIAPSAVLPEDLGACHAVIHELHDALHTAQRRHEQLEHYLRQLLKQRFGPRSDRLDPNQLALFAAEVLEQAGLSAAELKAKSPTPGNGPAERRERKLPAELPRQQMVYDLSEEQKCCPACGEPRVKIGQETSEQLEMEPAKLYVIERVRLTYACRKCEGQVVTADVPSSPIAKGRAGPGLLAQVITGKYGDHLPLYRQEQILERSGRKVPRSTTCGWMSRCASLVQPLYDKMLALMLASKVIHTDDTPVPVLAPGLGKTRQGRLWVYVGDAAHPYTVFDYTPTRSRDGPTRVLEKYAGYIQADAYGGYDHLFKSKGDGAPLPREVGCWAHARRKFVDAESTDPPAAHTAVALIGRLYEVESRARGLKAGDRAALRREESIPRLEQIKTWLEAQEFLPKSPLGEARGYALGNWTALTRYVEDGDLAIDNNTAENAIRPVALGRKNWLFAGSDAGGRTGAILSSLVSSCKRHGLDPVAYLRDVLTRIADTSIAKLDQFLPDQWKAARAAAACSSPVAGAVVAAVLVRSEVASAKAGVGAAH